MRWRANPVISGDPRRDVRIFDGSTWWADVERNAIVCDGDVRWRVCPWDGDIQHVNGFDIEGPDILVTACSKNGFEVGDWRTDPFGGVLYTGSRAIAEGLCMPHSPRWWRRNILYCEAGTGRLRGAVTVELPGFTRGLLIDGDTAYVGLSCLRHDSWNEHYPIMQREAQAGVAEVDLRTGSWQVTAIEFDEVAGVVSR